MSDLISGPLELGRVLIADDDEFARMIATEALSSAGFSVTEASNGVEAVALFRSSHPEVVLLDVEMPELDGFGACAEIRQCPGGRDTPILMLTGKDDILSIERAYEAGATDFTNKPVNWLIMAKRVAYMRRSGQLTRELRTRRQQLEEVHRLAGMGHWNFHWDSGELRCSPRAQKILRLPALSSRDALAALTDRIHSEDLNKFDRQLETARLGRPTAEIEYRIVGTDGQETFVRQRIEAVLRPEQNSAAAIVQDITRERAAEQRADFLARYDRTTGLANRQTILEMSRGWIPRGPGSKAQLAVVSLGFPELQELRLSLGNEVTNKVLELSAQKLLALEADLLGLGYSYQIGRVAEEEFCVVLSTEQTRGQLPAALARLEATFLATAEIDDHSINLQTPIGVALFPEDGASPESLLQAASQAMRTASSQRATRATFADATMDQEAKQKFMIKNELHLALERSELSLAFQPQLSAEAGELVGVEALARWHHETLGHISPAVFIPLAEEAGLIQQMGQWVFAEACRWQAYWRDQGLDLRMAVNLSSRQFEDPRLADKLLDELERHGLQGRNMEIEITESVVLEQNQSVEDALNALKSAGIRIAIDDFGVGHSSLRSLAGFAFDTIKIDRSFVEGVPEDPKKTAITRAILAMARSLGLRTIAEGIELQEQWHFLTGLCDEVQGFYFSKPLPPEDILTVAGQKFRVPA